jgi:hypothetical protein
LNAAAALPLPPLECPCHCSTLCCSTDLLALPTCDPDKSFAVQMGHEETMVNGPVAYVQCALLHTSSSGERRIRLVGNQLHWFSAGREVVQFFCHRRTSTLWGALSL